MSDNTQQQSRWGSRWFFNTTESLFDSIGLDTAAENLRHYRSGRGADRKYSDNEMQEHPYILDAEDTNRTRFTSRTFTGRTGDPKINDRLLNLSDEETYEFPDHWNHDFDIRKGNEIKDSWISRNWYNIDDLHSTLDTYKAFGRHEILSNGQFSARREGGKLYVTGTVNHGFDGDDNRYDFNHYQPGHGSAVDLEAVGEADPYKMLYDREQDVEAVLEYGGDGRLYLLSEKWGHIR